MTTQNGFGLLVTSEGRPISEMNDLSGAAYVVGEAGQTFQVRLSNDTQGRALAVLKVDELNAVNGVNNELKVGYIVPPGGRLSIDGWFFPPGQILNFQFGQLPAGFRHRMDEPKLGVIEVTYYLESPQPIYSANMLNQLAYRKVLPRSNGWGGGNSPIGNPFVGEQFDSLNQVAATLSLVYRPLFM